MLLPELLVFLAVAAAAALGFAAFSTRPLRLRRRLSALSGRVERTGDARIAVHLVEAQEGGPAGRLVRVVLALLLPALLVLAAWASDSLRSALLIPAAALLACAGFLAPLALASGRERRRGAAILRSLPDVLDLLVICVEAGLGLNAAFQRVAERIGASAPELSSVLRVMHQEIQAGRSREEALRAMAARVRVDEVRALSVLLIQTDRLGTGIAAALRIHAEALRARFHHQAEARAARATVKLAFPLVLCIFPALIAVIVGPAALKLLAAFGGKP